MVAPVVTSLIALFTVAFVLSRKAPAWTRRLRYLRAFRAGKQFFATYPHIAKDIAYGNGPRQTLDVYWPPQGERLPVLLFAHGGSWNWGDKSLYPLVGARFTEQGFVAVVINYSLYPQNCFPTFVEDAAAAVAWTVNHIADYHGDPGHVFVGGHSAGGHILSLVALDDRYLAAHGLTRDVLRGLIGISVPSDLTAMLRHLEAHPSVGSAAGLQAVMGGPEQLPQADPIRHARADGPPVLLLHGDRDDIVPIGVARDFASALKTAGAQVDLYEYPRADHFSIVLDSAYPSADRPSRLLSNIAHFVHQVSGVSAAGS